MSSIQSDHSPDGQVPAETSPAGAVRSVGASVPRNRARWCLALGGLAAGLAAFGLGETTYELIPAEKVAMSSIMGTTVVAPSVATMRIAEARNGALSFAVLGMCLGGLLGIAGGLARKSPRATAGAGMLGVILGAGLAAGASLALLPFCLEAQHANPDSELIVSIIMHASIWGATGAVAGLAFAVGLGDSGSLARYVAAGLAGAMLGSIAFDLLGAMFFPFAFTGQPVSITWQTRALARLVVTVTTAAMIILLLTPRHVRADGRSPAPASFQ